MHLADAALGLLGTNGIVAGGMPMAAGAALAHKLDGSDDVVVGFLGEGGVNQGTFHEALNLAALWKLPVVYVIENNLYTEYVHYRSITSIDRLSDRASSYGIPGVTVDGQDVFAVHEAATEAISRARLGEGPSLLEAVTFRFHGHHEGEEQILGRNVYRTVEEIEREQRDRDPIDLARDRIADVFSLDEIEATDAEVEECIARAVEFAEESPLPDAEDANAFVYAAG
jgi:pyruvate dehydrogenase E1 component alpha subunit